MTYEISDLRALEAEAIHVIREVAAEPGLGVLLAAGLALLQKADIGIPAAAIVGIPVAIGGIAALVRAARNRPLVLPEKA